MTSGVPAGLNGAYVSDRIASASRAGQAEGIYLRQLTIMVYSFPLLWVAGVAGFWWIAVAFLAVADMAKYGVDRIARPLLWVVALMLISAPIGYISFQSEPLRVAGLLGNCAVWIATAAAISDAVRSKPDPRPLTRAILFISVVQGILTLASAVIYPKSLPIPLIGVNDLEFPGGASAFQENGLYYLDWLGEASFRSAGMMGNPTWAGAFGVVAILAAVAPTRGPRNDRVLRVAGFLSGVVAIWFSLSRSTIASLLVAMILSLFLMQSKRSPLAFLGSGILLALAGLLAYMFWLDAILASLAQVNAARAGSLTSRTAIYERTYAAILSHPFPAIGYGIKPREEGLVASVATHSTYLGLIFRGGLLAMAALALFSVRLCRTLLAGRRLVPVLLGGFIAVWSLLEDFDGAHLVPLGLVIALLASHSDGGED